MNDIVPLSGSNQADVYSPMEQYELAILNKVGNIGLPTSNVLVKIENRITVLNNVKNAIEPLASENRKSAVYMSKFMLAISAGLFDAALNYLWDETIQQLRNRIIAYDLNYFFDQAVADPEKRKDLKSAEDLEKITDDELIRSASKIGFISSVGQQQLDLVRYMRNHASAAHPNQYDVKPYQILAFLETCIREVIVLPESQTMVATARLLHNVKETQVDEKVANELAGIFQGLRPDQVEMLATALFGIYTDLRSTTITRDNVRLLAPKIWSHVPESVRANFGVRQARFRASLDEDKAKLAREFLDAVDGLSYLSEDVRYGEIEGIIDELRRVHEGMNNFYNEPSIAERLFDVVGTRNIPLGVESRYVETLSVVFLGNFSGVSWKADKVYVDLMSSFTPGQAARSLYCLTGPEVSAILSGTKPRSKFSEAINLLRPKYTGRAAKELAGAVEEFISTPDKMSIDSKLKKLRGELEIEIASNAS